MPFEEITPAAELRQEPPKFVASTTGLQAPMDDAAVRAIFENAAAQGIDDLGALVPTPAQQGQPAPVQQAPIEVPAKFQKPDGTVDEEKLKTSTARLDEVIQEKQKTVEELLADYKAKEREFHDKTKQVRDIQSQVPQTQQPLGTPILPPDQEQTRRQLLQLQQEDPIAFAVEIARHVARREAQDVAAPALQAAQHFNDQQRDSSIRSNIANIAEQDPRILNPLVYAEFQKELNNPDENYFSLKNPHKAAWNEVKGRLRLGDTNPAQPSNPSPVLGRGNPTSVQGLGQPQTTQSMNQQVGNVDPYSEEGKRLEAQLRQASESVWRH